MRVQNSISARETTARVHIVGTGVIPLTDHLGRGAAMTLDGLARLNPDAVADNVFVRRAPGAKPDAVVDTMREIFSNEPADSFALMSSQKVATLTHIELIDLVPVLFASLMSLVAALVLAHVLITATRACRRDHAVLRALGFTHGQTVRTVVCQADKSALLQPRNVRARIARRQDR